MKKFLNDVKFISKNQTEEVTILLDLDKKNNLPILFGVGNNELFDNFHIELSELYIYGCIPIKPQHYHTLFRAGVVTAVKKHIPSSLGTIAYLCQINKTDFIEV